MFAEQEPTQEELLAMAYADGELDSEARRDFESRMQASPGLAQEVAEYQALEVLSRNMAPPVPMDLEWERLAIDPTRAAGLRLGWGLIVLGAFGGSACGLYEVANSDLPPMPMALVFALIGGFIVLFMTTLRARLRTLPYDAYRKVKR